VADPIVQIRELTKIYAQGEIQVTALDRISLDIAARNARVLGHSVADEIRILMLHGILHLAGYDHESDKGEMAKKEILLRRRLELPTSLIERSNGSTTRKRSTKSARTTARLPR